MGLAIPQVITPDSASGAQVIGGSLKFDEDNNTYLKVTPGSAGDRRTWTWSGWVKRSTTGSSLMSRFFMGGSTSVSTGTTVIAFYQDRLFIDLNGSSARITTSRLFRDTGWYHIVLAVDTTIASPDFTRVKIYVNGEQQIYFNAAGYPSEDFQTAINSTQGMLLGAGRDSGGNEPDGPFDGLITNAYLIDGLQLDAGYFGFTDPLTGTWRPRKFKAEGTTVNDGTVFSSTGTFSNWDDDGSYPKTELFDGTLYTGGTPNGASSDSSSEATFDLGNHRITGFQNLKINIFISSNQLTASNIVSVNGIDITQDCHNQGNDTWTIVDLGSKFTSLQSFRIANNNIYVGGFIVDGVIMKDSTTENLAFGTNGFYLPLENQSDFEKDKSGRNNNFSKNGFTGTVSNPDIVKDSPSGAASGGPPTSGITTTSSVPANYATLNPININDMAGTTSVTISDGNLTVANARNTYFGTALSNLSMTSGKYYCEGTVDSNDATTLLCGILKIDPLESRWNTDDEQIGYSQYGYGYRSNNGNKENNLSNSSYGDSYGDGDTIGIALDLDAKTISFYKNGTNQGVAYSGIPAGEYAFGFSSSETNNKWKANFGQKPFKYAPPKGFLPLNTSNTRSLSVITRPNQYVGVATYIGSGNSSQDIIFGFKPDFAWTKSRTTAENHGLFDSVRGLPKFLRSDSTDDEYTLAAGTPVSFISNGINFTNGSGEINESTRGYVAWAWKAGGDKNTFNVDDVGYASASAAGLDSGSINPTGASVGTKQGFSILKFTAPSDSGTKTISHGLSQTPEFYIFKETNRNSTAWYIFHHSVCDTNTKFLRFDTTALQSGAGNVWGNLPTSSLVSIQNGSLNAVSSQNILYAWHSVPGLQKFGTYTGNGSADGPFVELSFRPSIVWIRRTDSGQNWAVHDSERDKSNECDKNLAFNLSSVENNSGDIRTADANEIDFLSNGFKLRDSAAVQNADGGTYIYCAWAEASTSGLFGGGANAR